MRPWCRTRSRRRCRRGWRPNRTYEPEHLFGRRWPAKAGRSEIPGGADTESTARVLPSRWGIGLYRPFGPTPLAVWIGGLVGLHRDPTGAGSECNRCGQGYFEDAVALDIRLTGPAGDERPGQTTIILVEEDVEVIGWARSIEIYALRINFGDPPALASRHKEVVSQKGGKFGKIRELLRCPTGHSRVV